MATTIEVDHFPPCDFCDLAVNRKVRSGTYDFKTKGGPWANGCQEHYMLHRMYPDLGTGKGQKRVLRYAPNPNVIFRETPITDAIHEGLKKHGDLLTVIDAEGLDLG